MSVLRNMAGRWASRVDEIAALWLPRHEASSLAGRRDTKRLRAVAAVSLTTLPVAPLALSLAMPVSSALPLGTALWASASLLAAAVAIARGRVPEAGAPAPTDPVLPDLSAAYDLLPVS